MAVELYTPISLSEKSFDDYYIKRTIDDNLANLARHVNDLRDWVTTAKIAPTAITATEIAADAVTATKINVVGLDGTTGRIVVADATDANVVTGGINSYASTLITAGKIVISGSTNLDDWSHASDATTIDGGDIYTNTITTSQIAADAVTAAEINVVGLDGASGKIILSQIESGDLDDIGDGTTYSRVKTTDITAGHVLLTECTGDLDDIGDGSTYGKVSLTDITAGRIALSYESGKIVIGGTAIAGARPGVVVNDGTYDRALFGEITSGVFAASFKDAAGNVTVDLGSVMGASDYQSVDAVNEISTTSTSFTDMTDMSITHTFPKCIALYMSLNRLDTSQDNALNGLVQFYHDGLVGDWTGVGDSIKAMCTNLHVEALAAGAHTIKLQWMTSDADGDSLYCTQRRLIILFWEVQ